MKNIGFLVLITIFFAACGKKETPKTAVDNASTEVKMSSDSLSMTNEQLQLMHIELGKAERHALVGTIIATGKVAVLANDMAEISSPLRGTVQEIFAHEGQFVKKGQLLMTLTSPEIIGFQRDYLVAQSELFFLEKELERQQIMAKENVGAAKNEQEIRSKVMMQKAILKTTAARLKLADIAPPQYDGDIVDKIRIISPISGYIDAFPASIGTMASEGLKLVHIKSFNDPHADIALYERDLQKIHAGQAVRLKFADPSVPEVVGHIEFIGRDIDPTSKTLSLHVPFTAPAGKVIATDMILTAMIESSGTQPTMALPESAVVQDEGKYMCFVVEKNDGKSVIFKKLEFVPTSISGGWIGLGENIEGKQIVVRGANVLLGEIKKTEVAN